MSNEEAKFILQSYRHNGADADDPAFAEALEQTRHDPELSQWFAEQRQFDAAIGRKIKSASVPANLKSTILAGEKIARPAISWRPVWLAAAAVVLLLSIGILWLQSQRAPEFAAFRDSMIQQTSLHAEHITFAKQDLNGIQQWLRDHNMKADFDLPAALNHQPVHGCKIVDWNTQKVALICFVLENKHHADLFMIDRTRFHGFTPSEIPRFGQAGDVVTATWARGDKVYLLAGKGNRETLLKYL